MLAVHYRCHTVHVSCLLHLQFYLSAQPEEHVKRGWPGSVPVPLSEFICVCVSVFFLEVQRGESYRLTRWWLPLTFSVTTSCCVIIKSAVSDVSAKCRPFRKWKQANLPFFLKSLPSIDFFCFCAMCPIRRRSDLKVVFTKPVASSRRKS